MEVMVGIIGGDSDAAEVLNKGLKQFPCKKVHLIATPKGRKQAAEIAKDITRFKISAHVHELENPRSIEDVFASISRVREPNARIIVNVDTDYQTSCLALSAAFVNGVQAIGLMGDDIIAYPIMKFSYFNALSDKKIRILQMLHKVNDFISFDQLSKKLRMSLPLMSYHINGNLKSMGLKQLGLIEIQERGTHKSLKLNQLGTLIAKGYVDYEKE